MLLPSRWTTPGTRRQLWNIGPACSQRWTVKDDVPLLRNRRSITTLWICGNFRTKELNGCSTEQRKISLPNINASRPVSRKILELLEIRAKRIGLKYCADIFERLITFVLKGVLSPQMVRLADRSTFAS